MIRPCLRTKWHINPFSRLATTDMGRKLGEELGPHLTQCRRVEAYLHTKWHLGLSNRLAAIDVGRKLGDCVPFWRGSTSNTMSLWSRHTSKPSGILIHPAVWPQYTWAENSGGEWGCAPFLGELGSHLTQCGLGPCLPPCQVSF